MKNSYLCVKKQVQFSQMTSGNIVTVELLPDSNQGLSGTIILTADETTLAFVKPGSKYLINLTKEV